MSILLDNPKRYRYIWFMTNTNRAATTHFKGHLAEYTGKVQQIHGGTFYEVLMLEGPSKGENKVVTNAPPKHRTCARCGTAIRSQWVAGTTCRNTAACIRRSQQKSVTNEVSDEMNPWLMFQTTNTDLLLRIARGEINPTALAKQELANRGLDIRTGQWVGFAAAKETAKLHAVVGRNGKTVFVSVPE